MDPSFVYTGPSWAVSSFPNDRPYHITTNLASEWNINCINYAKNGNDTLESFELVKTSSLPIIWVYEEPIKCLTKATGMGLDQFVSRQDWKEIWSEVNQFCLKKISSIGVPVLLIGGHSDIVDCNYTNIKVAHVSWQKFLADKASMNVNQKSITVKPPDSKEFQIDLCWGVEIVQCFVYTNPKIIPVQSLIDNIWHIFCFWKQLEKSGWFYGVHPNYRATVTFAQYLKPMVLEFLQDIK
jgi:hypothetical protein